MPIAAIIERTRARLAEMDREVARLQYRHDIAMSAFLFEEATALGREIAALDKERQALAADLPTAEPTAKPPTGIVPKLMRSVRTRRRRMG
jgi:hypothetical protein